MSKLSKDEMIWNETMMFGRELINPKYLDTNWNKLPEKIKEQFSTLIGPDVNWAAYFKEIA